MSIIDFAPSDPRFFSGSGLNLGGPRAFSILPKEKVQ